MTLPTAAVDVVVCVHNALAHVRRCLNSVLAHSGPELNELIVVDDGSDRQTREYLASKRANLGKLVRNDRAKGFTKAANRGLKQSGAPYVVLLNSDTEVPMQWLDRLVAAAESHPAVGMASPLSNAATWQSVPDTHSATGQWAVNALRPGQSVETMDELVQSLSACAYPQVPLLNGFCLLIKQTVLQKIGYLDELNFPRGYGEENDFCLRAEDAGIRCVIADNLYVYHAKSRSFGHWRRWWYSRRGGRRLHQLYGAARLQEATAQMKNAPVLNALRDQLSHQLNA